MISRKMITKLLCENFEKNGFKKDTVFLVQFVINLHYFLKNSLVQISSKLNEKNRMITYTNTKKPCITILYHAIENSVASTINTT